MKKKWVTRIISFVLFILGVILFMGISNSNIYIKVACLVTSTAYIISSCFIFVKSFD